jgi:hypothetical protein
MGRRVLLIRGEHRPTTVRLRDGSNPPAGAREGENWGDPLREAVAPLADALGRDPRDPVVEDAR